MSNEKATSRQVSNYSRAESKDGDMSCGLGGCRPVWLQPFATSKIYLIVYGLLGTIQSMSFVYFIAIITTLEKRFKIQSRSLAIALCGNEISQITLALFLTYYGGQSNRPKWIAWGVSTSALSCYIMALPHFLFGAGKDAIELATTETMLDPLTLSKTRLCNETVEEVLLPDDCTSLDYTWVPLFLIFLSQFVLGIGTTLYYTLGTTYLDDNSKKTSTPMLFAFASCLRLIGPIFGFTFASFCLRLYIDPSLTPTITNKDPRWLGAWWIGWLVMGTIMLCFSFLIGMFPKKLPNKLRPIEPSVMDGGFGSQPLLSIDIPEERPKMKDFPKTIKRLMSNKILMTNILSSIFYILGGSGYMTFMTKYMETQFQKSAATASISGITSISAMAVGLLLSGVVLSYFKPRARYVAGWNVVAGSFYLFAQIIFVFLGCTTNNINGLNATIGEVRLINQCNMDCGCEHMKYSPVCSEDGLANFYSACHAGCKTELNLNGSKTYGDCSCIWTEMPTVHSFNDADLNEWLSSPSHFKYNETAYFTTASATAGPCDANCDFAFTIFLIVLGVMHLVSSSGRIGNILVTYRCVDEKDKALAQGIGVVFISLLAFIPGPILYGAVIDSACLVWGQVCGNKGHCWLYDSVKFRYYLNLTSAVFTIFAIAFDAGVCYYVKDLKLYGEDEEKDLEKDEKWDKNKPKPKLAIKK